MEGSPPRGPPEHATPGPGRGLRCRGRSHGPRRSWGSHHRLGSPGGPWIPARAVTLILTGNPLAVPRFLSQERPRQEWVRGLSFPGTPPAEVRVQGEGLRNGGVAVRPRQRGRQWGAPRRNTPAVLSSAFRDSPLHAGRASWGARGPEHRRPTRQGASWACGGAAPAARGGEPPTQGTSLAPRQPPFQTLAPRSSSAFPWVRRCHNSHLGPSWEFTPLGRASGPGDPLVLLEGFWDPRERGPRAPSPRGASACPAPGWRFLPPSARTYFIWP